MTPPLYRILEIVLYAAVVFIPFFLIACVPYKRKLRFRPVPSCLIMLCAIGVHAYLFYLYEYSNAAGGNLTIAALIVNYLTFYCLYRAPLGQLFFTLLMLTNISNFVIVAAKCMQYALFPPPPRWRLSISAGACLYVWLPCPSWPMFLFMSMWRGPIELFLTRRPVCQTGGIFG